MERITIAKRNKLGQVQGRKRIGYGIVSNGRTRLIRIRRKSRRRGHRRRS